MSNIYWGAFDSVFPASFREAQYARSSHKFYSPAAIVGIANSTDSAAGWKSTPLRAGRSWKRDVLFQTLLEEA